MNDAVLDAENVLRRAQIKHRIRRNLLIPNGIALLGLAAYNFTHGNWVCGIFLAELGLAAFITWGLS